MQISKECKKWRFSEGELQGGMEQEYAMHRASTLLKLKSEFHNSKLESIDNNPNDLVFIWKGLEFEQTNSA